jgi:hypothetical protein
VRSAAEDDRWTFWTTARLAACNAVIDRTREKGLGLAVIEAAAVQRPGVAFEGGGNLEIVLLAGS